MNNKPWVRPVYQCLTCTWKSKEQPVVCANCANKDFTLKEVYCLDAILAYGCFMNVIVGRRRGGKSFRCGGVLCETMTRA